MSSLLVRVVATIFPLLLLLAICVQRWRARFLPPGPPGVPIIEHALNIPKRSPYKVFANWSRQFGGIISVNVFRRRIVIINSFEIADDLLNKQCAVFSNRPFRVMAHLSEYDHALAFMSQGDRFRRTRRQLHDALNARAVPAHFPHLDASTRRFLNNVLSSPHNLHDNIRLLFIGSILSFVLGYNAASEEDAMVSLSERVGNYATEMMTSTGKFWVELLPNVFRYLPIWATGPRISRCIYEFRDTLRALLALSDVHVRKCMKEDAPPSFLSSLLARDSSPEATRLAAYSSVSLYGGAVDTTISVTTSFFLALMRHPEAQAKAHAEIDHVVGRHRLPTPVDRASLPYVDALLIELLRWAPPIPLTSRSLPHDEQYMGFMLPKNTTVIANIWAMNRDESRFRNPEEFRPERFYLGSPAVDAHKKSIYHLVFGFGRRVCPGKFYADAWLWLVLSGVLATCTVSPPGGPGTPVPEPEVEEGAILQLKHFACRVEPRFEGAHELVREAGSGGPVMDNGDVH